MRKVLGGLFGAVIFCSIVWTIRSESSWRPNILIISLCSVGLEYMPVFSANKGMPNLEKFMRSATFYGTTISSHPWNPINAFLKRKALFLLHLNNYSFIEPFGFYRIPDSHGLNEDSKDSIANYKAGIEELKRRVFASGSEPFFINTFIKYAHTPLWDNINQTDEDLLAKLTEPSRNLAKKYLTDRADLKKATFLNFLFGDPKLAQRYLKESRSTTPNELKNLRHTFWLNVEPRAVQQWHQSLGFEQDLTLLKEVYHLKLSKLDQIISPVLDLWGDEKLKKNTVVILDTDHGMALMQHGVLAHGSHVYDEFLSGPIVVSLPWSKQPIPLHGQISKLAISKFIASIISGERDVQTLRSIAEDVGLNEFIVSRNCRQTIYSVRTNKWKLIRDGEVGDRALYDLETDPNETSNVYESFPEEAYRLENVLIDKKDLLEVRVRLWPLSPCLPNHGQH